MSVTKEQVKIVDGKINYSCLKENCPSSCCGPFGGVYNGLESVNGTAFSEIILTDSDAHRFIDAGLAELIELNENKQFRMKLHPNGSCKAFINNRCSVHGSKPSICRAFPFYIDMFVGLCTVSGTCPGCGGEDWTELKDLQDEIAASKHMYQFWIEGLVVKDRE